MSTTENLKNTFGELVEAYDDADDDAKEPLAKKIKDSGKSAREAAVTARGRQGLPRRCTLPGEERWIACLMTE